jgi:hypothetical protein
MTIQARMMQVMQDVGAVRKGDKNQAQGFSFRGIDAVVNAVAPALKRHGVIVMPHLQSVEYAQVEVGKNRTAMMQCRVVVQYAFIAEDGSNLGATVAAEALDSGDKATAKAMSVAFRTALLQALCLPTDEPDPDHDVYERAPAFDADMMERALSAIQEAESQDQLVKIETYLQGQSVPLGWADTLRHEIAERRAAL